MNVNGAESTMMPSSNNSLRAEIYAFLGSNDAYVLNEEFIDTEHCTNQIIMMIEKRIDSIERYPSNNEYQVCWNKGADDIIKQIKEMLK